MVTKYQIPFILLLTCLCNTYGFAQTATATARQINSIKRDTTYIYAEATTSNADSALYNAKAILELKVDDWIRLQHPNDSIKVCIAKAKEHTFELHTRRGNLQRAFVYVRKRDILPIADQKDIVVFQVSTKAATQTQPLSTASALNGIAPEEAPQPKPKADPAIVLTPEEQKMKDITDLSSLNAYVVGLRDQQRLNGYGKYATVPKDKNCHIIICDKQGVVLARLRHQSDGTLINLNTLKTDAIENYHAGAIWFQVKE